MGTSKEEDSSSDEVVEVVPQRRKHLPKRREYYTESEGCDSEEYIDRSRKALLYAEREKVVVPLSGLQLQLIITGKDRVGATAMLKWVTSSGSVSTFGSEFRRFCGLQKQL